MNQKNIIINCDGYKPSHAFQLPPDTAHISSYICARAAGLDLESGLPKDRSLFTTFFGLQGFINEYLMHRITQSDIDEAEDFFKWQGAPFNKDMWQHILDEHEGALPLRIQAIPEGYLVPIGTPLVQVINTDPECAALTSCIETALLRAVWYPTTVATLSTICVEMIRDFLMITGTPELAPYKLVDFGQRGATSFETACIGGAAHLLNSSVSDTMNGVAWAERNYDADIMHTTIPASEHSTMTSWPEEVDAIANMIQQFGDGMFAVVIDSYNDEDFIKIKCGKILKAEIDELPSRGGTMIFRPDSGNCTTHPVEVLNWLGEVFGTTANDKGFKVLPNHIRVLQGDGMTPSTLLELLNNITNAGWSVDNIAFGMGGGLLQGSEDWGITRDTHRFAMKANERESLAGEKFEVKKNPITDPTKASIGGRVHVYSPSGNCADITWCSETDLEAGTMSEVTNLFPTVFMDGLCLEWYCFDDIRGTLEKCKEELRNHVIGEK